MVGAVQPREDGGAGQNTSSKVSTLVQCLLAKGLGAGKETLMGTTALLSDSLENGQFMRQGIVSESVEGKWISRVNMLLHGTSDEERLCGVRLLGATAEQCSGAVFEEKMVGWTAMLNSFVKRKDNEALQMEAIGMLVRLMGLGVQYVELKRDLVKEVTRFFEIALGMMDDLEGNDKVLLPALLEAMISSAKLFPSTARNFVGKVSVKCVALIAVGSKENIHLAAILFGLLPMCGSSSQPHGEVWMSSMLNVVGTVNHVLNEMCSSVDCESFDCPNVSSLLSVELPGNSGDRSALLVRYFNFSVRAMRSLMENSFPQICTVPVDLLLSTIARGISAGFFSLPLKDSPTFNKASYYFYLTYCGHMHVELLAVLKSLIETGGTHLLPYGNTILKIIGQTLNSFSEQRNGENCESSRLLNYKVRIASYKCLSEILSIFGSGMGSCDKLLCEVVVPSILLDIKPLTRSTQLESTSQSSQSNVTHGKKRRKVAHGSHKQDNLQCIKISVAGLGELASAALEALDLIMCVSSESLTGETRNDVLRCLLYLLNFNQRRLIAPYQKTECLLRLYQSLVSCLLSSNYCQSPFMHMGMGVLSVGCSSNNAEIRKVCLLAKRNLDYAFRPRAPVVFSGLHADEHKELFNLGRNTSKENNSVANTDGTNGSAFGGPAKESFTSSMLKKIHEDSVEESTLEGTTKEIEENSRQYIEGKKPATEEITVPGMECANVGKDSVSQDENKAGCVKEQCVVLEPQSAVSEEQAVVENGEDATESNGNVKDQNVCEKEVVGAEQIVKGKAENLTSTEEPLSRPTTSFASKRPFDNVEMSDDEEMQVDLVDCGPDSEDEEDE
eukprot:Nk52_evm25s1705 gene=Nk52_evmTU25s1705